MAPIVEESPPMIDFEPPPELAQLRERTRRFIAEEIMPMEGDPRDHLMASW